jgi:hypothetical protein
MVVFGGILSNALHQWLFLIKICAFTVIMICIWEHQTLCLQKQLSTIWAEGGWGRWPDSLQLREREKKAVEIRLNQAHAWSGDEWGGGGYLINVKTCNDSSRQKNGSTSGHTIRGNREMHQRDITKETSLKPRCANRPCTLSWDDTETTLEQRWCRCRHPDDKPAANAPCGDACHHCLWRYLSIHIYHKYWAKEGERQNKGGTKVLAGAQQMLV